MLNLDERDRKIIRLLDDNSRLSVTVIAKKSGISVSNVTYRLESLRKNRIMEEFYVLLNPFAFKNNYDRIMFRLRADWPKDKITNYCKSDNSIGWFISFDGSWNFSFQVWSNNMSETKDTLQKFLESFGDYVEEYVISSVLSIEKHEHQFFYDKDTSMTTIVRVPPVDINTLDRKIMSIIFRDSRLKLLDIAKKVHSNYKVVNYRLKNLIKNNVIIGYKLKLNRFNTGYDYYKIKMDFKSYNKKDIMTLKEFLRNDKHVMFITEALGWADLEFEIFCKNQEEYRMFQDTLKRIFVGIIRNYETLIPLEFDWNHFMP